MTVRRSREWGKVFLLVVCSALAAACASAPLPQASKPLDGHRPAAPVPQPAGQPVVTQPSAPQPPAAPATNLAAAFKPGAIVGARPTQPIEFVISTSPGGGSDIYARFIIGIIEKFSLSPQPFIPVNKDGGAGASAMQYVDTKKSDPHTLMITLNSYLTTPMLQKLPFTSESFTPVALLALDSFFLWVPVDSPFESLDDFLQEAKHREISVAGTGSKQEDEIVFKLIEMRAGTKPFKYVPLRGGGDVCTALAGKQVEATVNNPSECASFYPAQTRPLAAFLDDRSPAYKNLPTAKEQGLPISYANMRAVVAAPGISTDQQRWHISLMRQVFDSPDWQDFVQKNALEPSFLGGDDFAKFLTEYEKLHKDLMTSAGWTQ